LNIAIYRYTLWFLLCSKIHPHKVWCRTYLFGLLIQRFLISSIKSFNYLHTHSCNCSKYKYHLLLNGRSTFVNASGNIKVTMARSWCHFPSTVTFKLSKQWEIKNQYHEIFFFSNRYYKIFLLKCLVIHCLFLSNKIIYTIVNSLSSKYLHIEYVVYFLI
jgi:hypothetical protein